MSAAHSSSSTGKISQRRVPVIGIVGGIGCGKSAVAQWVAAQANVCVIDADRLGHDALRSPDVKTELRRLFGETIFDSSGEVERSVLAQRVFGESESHRHARRDLERVVHPEIERRIVDEIANAQRLGQEAVLLDAPVLLEAGWERRCDAVAFVEASDAVRQQRVRQRSGWTLEELQRREASQMSLSEKRRHCDVVVDNSGPVSAAGEQLLTFLRREELFSCKRSSELSKQSETSEFLPP